MKKINKLLITLSSLLMITVLGYAGPAVVKQMPLSSSIDSAGTVRVIVKVTEEFTSKDIGVILHKEEFSAGWDQSMAATLFDFTSKELRGYSGATSAWVAPEPKKLFGIGDTVVLWQTINVADATHALYVQLASETEITTVYEDLKFRASIKGQPYDTANFCTVFVNDLIGANALQAVEIIEEATVVDSITPYYPLPPYEETEGFSGDGIYTIHCQGKKTFMSSNGVEGKPLPLQDSTQLGDDNKLYVVTNPTDTSKINIITLDGRYVGAVHTSGYGTWFENTPAIRDSSIAAAGLLEQATNAYYIDTYLGTGAQKMWNGQRNGSTAIGMGTGGGANYTWNFTRKGDMPKGNVAPSDIFLTADNIDENNAEDATVAMLSASDMNPFDVLTFSLADGADKAAFTITGNKLSINDLADFETKASYKINIKVSDGGGLSLVKEVTITINDVVENFVPTAIALSDTAIVENNIAGAVVGTLSASDPDEGDTFTFALEEDSVNGADNDAFTIKNNVLCINESADSMTQSAYKINVKVTDAGDLSLVKAFTIAVINFEETEGFSGDGIYTIHCQGKLTFMSSNGVPGAPMPLQDSTKLGDDNKLYVVTNPTDTNKINIITLDGRYVGAVHTSGFGTWFENTPAIRDSSIAAAGLLEQAANAYYIDTYLGTGVQKMWNGQRNGSTAVGMGTGGGANYTWNLTRIGDTPSANVAPSDIFLTVDSLNEGNSANDTIGMLSASDVNPFDSIAFSLGEGADNGSFAITGNMLTIVDIADFDTKASYSITVVATDKEGLTFEKAYTISVIEVMEYTAPTDIALSATAIDENNAAGATVATLSATDADVVDNMTFVFEADTVNGADNDAFTITDTTLAIKASADFETKTEYKINVKVTDAGGLTFVKAFTITVNDVNEAPTAITLSNDSIVENAAVGTLVGSLSATDADANSTFTYTLSGADAASFTIDGDALKSAEAFDFEIKASYSIKVTVSDGTLEFSKDMTITVKDLVEASLSANELRQVSFYPNPVKDELRINGLSVEATASIYSISGSLVKKAPVGESNNTIDVSDLSSGIYVLKLAVEGKELMVKIIK